MAFHKSNYGAFAGEFIADMNGYVPEQGDSPFAGAWDHGTERTHDDTGELTEYGQWWAEERFPEIVRENEEAKVRADADLEAWRANG